MFNQDSSQRGLLADDLVPHRLLEEPHVQPHDSELDDLAIGLPAKQDLAGIMLVTGICREHIHIDQRGVKRLHRDGHVMIMGQQRSFHVRQLPGGHFLEIPQLPGVRVEEPDKCLQVRA